MKTTAIVMTILGALCCCIMCLLFVTFSIGIFAVQSTSSPSVQGPTASPFDTNGRNDPAVATPVPIEEAAVSTGTETLDILMQVQIPIKDTAELVTRIGGYNGIIPETVPAPSPPYQVGDEEWFWASNTDTNDTFQVEATLVYVTDHAYFWFENGVRFDENDLRDLAEDFENNIYPTVRSFFGSEWSPGIDNDPRIYILFAGGLGNNLAGYFSSADEVHPLAHEYSNAHEMFFMSADNNRLNNDFTNGVLAHELQHMIHWNEDRNEEIWVNEGFSELAALLTGYYEGGFDYAYIDDTDIPLFVWPEDGETIPHYGGSFLFLTYFLDRFGENATKALVSHPDNGLNAIDRLLEEIAAFDPVRQRTPTATDIFQDFAAMMYLLDGEVGDGRYTLSIYPQASDTSPTERINSCPTGETNRDINQFGIDYIRITCKGSQTLAFQGSNAIRLLPTEAFSGTHFFWSNRADDADITLTRQFDFTDHVGALTLEYKTWFDIETDFDHAYLVASTNGETWEIIRTPSSTDEDPTGNSFGWAYNGKSPGWVTETVDISKYAGEEVWLRFEYITDGAVTGEGLLLDDISIPEIGYFTDFELDDGGWEPMGFVRIENSVPQTYNVSLITYRESGIEVINLELDETNYLELPIEIGDDIDEIVLVISATNRFSRQKAGYQFEISP